MPMNQLNRWLTLGANLGVVLGLIILIVELRQNSALSRAALEADKNNQLAVIELSLSTPAVAAALEKSWRDPASLTFVEHRLLDGHLAAVMLQWDNMLQIESAGLVSRERVRRHIENSAPFFFGSPYGKAWFMGEEAGWQGTDMWELALPVVQALDESFIEGRYTGLIVTLSQPDGSPGDEY